MEKVILEQKLNKVALHALQWEKIKKLHDLLSLFFANSVSDLKGDNYPTINQIINIGGQISSLEAKK